MSSLRPGQTRLWISAAAGASETFAAEELHRYLLRMSGWAVPVERHAGLAAGTLTFSRRTPTPWQRKLPPGSWRIEAEEDLVRLGGGSDPAVLGAAYGLLEQLGCRWSPPDEEQEVVPRLGEGPFAVHDQARTPTFPSHGYCSDIMTWHYTQPEVLAARLPDDRSFIDWMGKTGANSFFYIRHPFDTQLTIPELSSDFERRGIRVDYGGHVIPLLLPRELFDAHPSLFPASSDGTRSSNGNLCASNEEALAIAAENAVQLAREHPEMGALHVWGADLLRGGWCRCGGCAAWNPQVQSVRVCNAVAESLASSGLDRPVCFLAYHDTLEADLTLRPHPGVVCEFAPRERCFAHALNDPDCRTNRRYARALESWVRHFEGRVRIFEYYGDAILFFGCSVPLPGTIAKDLEYYRSLGITEVQMLQFGRFSQWAYPLNFLAFSSACGGLPPRGAIDRYFDLFGAEAMEVRQLHAELEAAMQTVVRYGDVRLKPGAAGASARLRAAIDDLLPRLGRVATGFAACSDDRLRQKASLVRYTQAVFAGMAQSIDAGNAEGMFAEALRHLDAVDPGVKGTWGATDLPILHSMYAAAAFLDLE